MSLLKNSKPSAQCSALRAQRQTLACGLVGVLCLALVGCASPERAGGDYRLDPQKSLEENLQLAAQAESTAPARKAIDAPPPPGVEPASLTRRPDSETRAWLGLSAAMLEISAQYAVSKAASEAPSTERPAASAPPGAAPTPDAAAEGLRHYLAGRQAALEGRYLVAVTELRTAHERDPTSSEILRELARSYAVVRNFSSSAATYEQLLALEPDDPEALLALALQAANQRDFARAAGVIATARLAAPASQPQEQDPGAQIVADYTLSVCLRQLGYDRASIQAARLALDVEDWRSGSPVYADRLASVYRQRGEIWRAIGDAHCRLGEYDQALEAYQTAGQLPTADPGALAPRLVYANLRLGRLYGAQRETLAALRGTVTDAQVRLCAYLAERSPTVQPLGAAVQEMFHEHPDDQGMARAAAALLPTEAAVDLLRRFVERHPADASALNQLLSWLDRRDPRAAAELAVGLVQARPNQVHALADRLAEAAARPGRTLDALATLPRTPARASIEVALRLALHDEGGAWNVCADSCRQWPEDATLLRLQFDIAAELEEPSLLDQPIASMACRNGKDPELWQARGTAHLALGQLDAAAEAARQVLDQNPGSASATLTLARVSVRRAAGLSVEAERRAAAADAARLVEHAIDLDRETDEPYSVLLTIYQSEGPGADPRLLSQTARRLSTAHPGRTLQVLVAAQDALAQRRFEQALEPLLRLYDSDPTNHEAVRLAVLAWQALDRLGDAATWLEARLAERPGNLVLREQWAQVLVQQGHADEAIKTLRELMREDAANPGEVQVLEQVLWRSEAAGATAEAARLAERRLRARPQGAHRELALAVLYAGSAVSSPSSGASPPDLGRLEQALQCLTWVAREAKGVTLDQCRAALDILRRMDRSTPGRNALRLELAQQTIDRFPDAPLAVYASGLLALAEDEASDERLDALVTQALRQCREAIEPSRDSLIRWSQVAQLLVDAGSPRAAGRVLRQRLRSEPPLESLGWAVLGNAAFAADAAASLGVASQAEASAALVNEIALAGRMPDVWPWLDAPIHVYDALYQVSTVYSVVGDERGAEVLLRKTLELQPEHAMAMNNLGYHHLELGIGDAETASMIEKAFTLDQRNDSVLDTLGWLRYRQGRVKDDRGESGVVVEGAVSLLRRAVELNQEPNAEVLDHLGDALWRSGATEDARDAWKRALAILEAAGHRERYSQMALAMQSQMWCLVVMDPERSYERDYGSIRDRLRAKLHAVETGQPPPITPTFAQVNSAP